MGREPIADAVSLLRTVASEIERLDGTGLIWFASFAAGADCELGVAGVAELRLLPTARSWLR